MKSTLCHDAAHHLCDWQACRCECHRTPPTCPVCGEPPGEGFMTYCSTEHLIAGSAV